MAQLAELLPPPGSDPLAVLDAFAAWAVGVRASVVPASGGRLVRPRRRRSRGAGDADRFGQEPGRRRRCVAGPQRRAAGGVDGADQGAGGREVLRPRRAARSGRGWAWPPATRRSTPRRRCLVCTAEVLANHALVTGPASPFGFACLDEFHYYGDPDRGWAWQVPLLELTACQMLLASATLGDMTAITTDLAERSRRGGHGGDLGRSADAALPPVAHDSGRRERPRGGRRRAQPGVRRARQPGGGDRAGAGARQPQRHHPPTARGDRRGDGRRSDGPGIRRHPRPTDPQRGRRPPRRDAAPVPPPRRASRRPGPAAGDLRDRHARRGREHPDPHRADDRAHQVRRHPGPALHGARVPPAGRPGRAARFRP